MTWPASHVQPCWPVLGLVPTSSGGERTTLTPVYASLGQPWPPCAACCLQPENAYKASDQLNWLALAHKVEAHIVGYGMDLGDLDNLDGHITRMLSSSAQQVGPCRSKQSIHELCGKGCAPDANVHRHCVDRVCAFLRVRASPHQPQSQTLRHTLRPLDVCMGAANALDLLAMQAYTHDSGAASHEVPARVAHSRCLRGTCLRPRPDMWAVVLC